MKEALKTPLYPSHIELGAKMVEFAGWSMPIQYEGIKEEHLHVRSRIGLFDVSHMGEIRVRGPKALETLQYLSTNDVSRLQSGEAQYSLLPNEQGGLVDDIIIYCLERDRDYLVCVNAANTAKDWDWMQNHNRGADMTNESSFWAQIAVQGPLALSLLDQVTGLPVSKLAPFQFLAWNHCWVARTGYTGEEGGEIFVPAGEALSLWKKLLGFPEVKPIGLGARDTLRTEMKYSLYGHEIDDQSNPYSAGLGWVVKPAAKDFLGKTKILEQKNRGLKQALVGFKMREKGIPRQGYSLCSPQGEAFGICTSGTLSPSLNEAIGIGYVPKEFSPAGSEIIVDIRGRKAPAVVVQTPFVETSLSKKNG